MSGAVPPPSLVCLNGVDREDLPFNQLLGDKKGRCSVGLLSFALPCLALTLLFR
jgi:hypothetical protein